MVLNVTPPSIQDAKRNSSTDQMWMQQVLDTTTKTLVTSFTGTGTNFYVAPVTQLVLATNTSAANMFIILPSPTRNVRITVKNISLPTHPVIVATTPLSLDTIDAASTHTLPAAYNSVTVIGFDRGTGLNTWYIIGTT